MALIVSARTASNMASPESTSHVAITALADDEELRRLAVIFGLDPNAKTFGNSSSPG
jgi:hypothetical protein